MKIRPLVVELFHVDRQEDGRADTTKLTVAFRNFSNAPNVPEFCPHCLF